MMPTDGLARLAQISSFELASRHRYDWTGIETELGFRLPHDYKEYVAYFPPGAHGGLAVLHPAFRDGFDSLAAEMRATGSMFESRSTAMALRGHPSSYAFYPHHRGLIPWAMFDIVAGLFWLPHGEDPETWPVVAYAEDNRHEVVPGTSTDALVRVLTHESGRAVFPERMYLDYDDPLRFVAAEDVELGPVE